MYNKTTLNNGLTVLSHQMRQRVSVGLGIWIKAGARYERQDKSGISHFLEHLLFKGTPKRSCEEIKQAIEGIGGALNGFTSEEFTCYLAKVPARYAASSLAVLADMVLNARLSPEDIELERKVILEEIRMYKDLPPSFVLELLTKLLWPNQPMGMNITGETASIEALKSEQLVAYKGEFYRLDNMAVVACGDLTHQQFLTASARCFPSSKQMKISKFPPASNKQTGPKLKLLFKDIEQTHLALGVYGLARNHPERFALILLHVILGANMSSRLFREVREKRGLAYDISTVLKFYQDTGAFIVHAGIDNLRIVEALEIILQQLVEIKKKRIAIDELNRAKEYYLGQLMLSLEDTSEHMLWLGENFVSLAKVLKPEEIIQGIKKVRADDLQRLANKIFQNQSLNLALIGPLKEKDKKQIKERLTV